MQRSIVAGEPEGHLLHEELPRVREQFGFGRTVCGCAVCAAFCRHIPGSLDVADLSRLCPPGQDVFVWAEQHLRARTDKPFPTLVPARRANGHCHWLVDGQCAVHDHAPYCCAFFDSHMDSSEVTRRYAPTVQARRADAASNGLYYRVWLHLCQRGLIDTPGNRAAVALDLGRIQRSAARYRQRSAEGVKPATQDRPAATGEPDPRPLGDVVT